MYGGWLLLAPEGTNFDNPLHRSRVSVQPHCTFPLERNFFFVTLHKLIPMELHRIIHILLLYFNLELKRLPVGVEKATLVG